MTLKDTQDFLYSQISTEDGEEIIRIFNYYIENSDAAFLESSVTISFFEQLKPLLEHYPNVAVRESYGNFIGFGLMRPHNPLPAFKQTVIITYFIDPGYTGKGIGTELLQILETKAREKGIKTILAEISSRNEGSIRFHEHHGFTIQGRFIEVGIKNGIPFDTIWMQKNIHCQ